MTGTSIPARVQDHVSKARLLRRLSELASIGGREDGGVSREALSAAELQARAYLIAEARALGCEVLTDACANLFFRRPGTVDGPPVMTGSHIDTQPVGGKLDGAYGVIGALEVIAALNDAGVQTRHPIEVVAWTNEEGCRFAPGTMGSGAFVDPASVAGFRESVGRDGVRFSDALDNVFAAFPDLPARAPAAPLRAYVELHIEQGPVLEQAGTPLGVVTGIQGVRWYRLAFSGTAAHAGTTPMDRRRDAMKAAVDMAQRLYALAGARAASGLRMTLGHWDVRPNSVNTIPDSVVFTIDARSPDQAVLERFHQDLLTMAAGVDETMRPTCELSFARAPTDFPAPMQALVERACLRAAPSHQPLRLVSGAFHDAMHLAAHCPTTMIFVPSRGGISHNAAEETEPHELFLGVRALAFAVAELAERE